MEEFVAEHTKHEQETIVRWYPMRIFHSSVKRQNELNELLTQEATVEKTYIPQNLIDVEENTYVPALVNYIFIRISLKNLKDIKANKAKYDHLRYVMSVNRDKNDNPITEITYVPNKQMEDFMKVIDRANEKVVMLENLAFACKPGQKVKITKGAFEGIEGTVKSIKKHLCVVIPIKNIMAVAITNVPRKYLERIEEQE
jgi:transcription antitermination factor NusG